MNDEHDTYLNHATLSDSASNAHYLQTIIGIWA